MEISSLKNGKNGRSGQGGQKRWRLKFMENRPPALYLYRLYAIKLVAIHSAQPAHALVAGPSLQRPLDGLLALAPLTAPSTAGATRRQPARRQRRQSRRTGRGGRQPASEWHPGKTCPPDGRRFGDQCALRSGAPHLPPLQVDLAPAPPLPPTEAHPHPDFATRRWARRQPVTTAGPPGATVWMTV
jgi:hypothetical protein